MIPQTIETVLRDFNWSNYGFHEFEDIEDPEQHEWPPVLAAKIAEAITPEIEAALAKSMNIAASLARVNP